MKLDTNFRDFYDHSFDLTGYVFRRRDNEGMTRREIFRFLIEIGCETPRHGLVKDLVPRILNADFPDWDKISRTKAMQNIIDVVVYTDENSHCGEGKIRISAAEAINHFPDHFAAEFISTTQSGIGVSFRYLQVGKRRWWLKYWSGADWRSNVGEGGVAVQCEEAPGYGNKIRYPLWAVDYLSVGGTWRYAVDFNIAPSLKPLQGLVTPSEIVDLIKQSRADGIWEGQGEGGNLAGTTGFEGYLLDLEDSVEYVQTRSGGVSMETYRDVFIANKRP